MTQKPDELGSDNKRPSNITAGRDMEVNVGGDFVSGNKIHIYQGADPTQLTRSELKERQKLLVLLDKVKKFWVNGVLEHGVPDEQLLALGRELSLEMIDHPWHDTVGAAVYDTHMLDNYKNTQALFFETDRALLILGAPGSGKTTTLLELARQLITLTEHDPHQPIPVVLTLSSWTKSKEPIKDWVLAELTAKYQIPRKTAEPWLEADQLLLLLDGLDEVAFKNRGECVDAINQFRTQHGLTGIVVSSRTDEYLTIGKRLKLGGAILLQALTVEQVDQYLERFNPSLEILRAAIQRDAVLQEMAQSPLMLRIMTVAYKDSSATAIGPEGNETADYHQHLFDTYVHRMIGQRGNEKYSAEQTIRWLSWLARKLTDHNQSLFLIEQIQPSWLEHRFWHWSYLFPARFIAGFFIGLIIWMATNIGQAFDPSFNIVLFEQVALFLKLPPESANFIAPQILMIGLGFLVAIVDGLYYERHRNSTKQQYQKEIWQRTAIVATVVAIASFSAVVIFDTLYLAFFASALVCFAFSLSSSQLDGSNFANEIRLKEAIGWSWQSAMSKGLLYGVISSVIVGGILTQVFGNGIFWQWLPPHICVGFILGGLQSNRLEKTSRPNQGIWLSARNSIFTTAIFLFSVGLIVSVIHSSAAGIWAGLTLGLMGGLIFGFATLLKHWWVRGILVIQGEGPIQYADFLNHAARKVLVYKVGGGYLFMHRLLQEYFATLFDSVDQEG